jgi:triosephosphate isomerase
MKKLLIVANWKCNPTTLKEAKKLFNSVKKGIKKTCPEPYRRTEVVICPPFVYLPILGTSISIQGFGGLCFGSQDCFLGKEGAFTGEISPKMLKNLGVKYVIIGHSERRKYQKETDEVINKKIKAVIAEGLRPILCVDKISQIKKDLKGVSLKELKNLVVAYEPLFAIGSGRPCPPEKAERMRISIQKKVKKRIRIIYGGSVNSQNARIYIEKAGFQGLLLGGASLKPKEFLKIVKNVDFFSKSC